jgi:hypothetical protein
MHYEVISCIGDVGILSADGSLDFLFSIYVDAFHLISRLLGAPNGFEPSELTGADVLHQPNVLSSGTITSQQLTSHKGFHISAWCCMGYTPFQERGSRTTVWSRTLGPEKYLKIRGFGQVSSGSLVLGCHKTSLWAITAPADKLIDLNSSHCFYQLNR